MSSRCVNWRLIERLGTSTGIGWASKKMPTSDFGCIAPGPPGHVDRLSAKNLDDPMNLRIDFDLAVRARRADGVEAAHRDQAGVTIVELVGLLALDPQGFGQFVGLLGSGGQALLRSIRARPWRRFRWPGSRSD